MFYRTILASTGTAVILSLGAAFPALAQTHVGNVVIDGSLCVGFDCPAGPSFSDATILMMENNTRIKFGDTSSTASFPRNDWELEANSQSNGGANRFSLLDCGENSNQGGCANDVVFAVEAGVRSNALYVESDGDVGIGTSNPAVDLTIVTGNTPTVRLQQDGSSGFAPQTWDMAGNEAGFFIRDATSGSTLPFRIITGGAPSQSLVIDGAGEIGMGVGTNPRAKLHVSNGGTAYAAAAADDVVIQDDAPARLVLVNTAAANPNWIFNSNNTLRVSAGADAAELTLDDAGNLTILGEITTSGSCSIGCDRVFDETYELPSIEEHAELMWSQKHLPNVGPTPETGAINVSDKVLRMLNELEHAHIYIAQLNAELKAQRDEIAALTALIADR